MSYKRETLTSSQTGTNNFFYFSFWTDGAGQVSYTNKAAGVQLTWSGATTVVARAGTLALPEQARPSTRRRTSMRGALGLKLGSHQIVATEGYFSSGSADITDTDGGSSNGGGSTGQTTTSVKPPTTTTTSTKAATSTASSGSGSGSCSAKWGQCGGNGWTGPTCCQSGSTCNFQNNWYSQCL
ncbi:hypothetical protein NEMBOFW57_006667 [Staphylotrichum longicolle]|uniref:CBM1 domain-containing protein n=1 Tax=Staphylotrichum longicolle TaxID=669026 RepID=A0AAD4HWQ2_9PEZI|nr:hypothetical protein NEMBOFW57_006667 [Staphylotrichum longicolle]